MNEIAPMSVDFDAVATPTLRPGGLERTCKEFEGIFLQMVLKEMDKTIESSGLLEDQGLRQTRSMCWMFLAEELGKQGGIGLWNQIKQSLADLPGTDEQAGKVAKP